MAATGTEASVPQRPVSPPDRFGRDRPPPPRFLSALPVFGVTVAGLSTDCDVLDRAGGGDFGFAARPGMRQVTSSYL